MKEATRSSKPIKKYRKDIWGFKNLGIGDLGIQALFDGIKDNSKRRRW
jgi:hypothetical protein